MASEQIVEHLVIGSGPSAAAVCIALTDAGVHPTILDIGAELDEPRSNTVARMRAQPSENWSDEDRRAIAGNMQPSVRGVALKTVFGSDYPYYDSRRSHALLETQASKLVPSQGLGGYSSVWGSASLPFAPEDMTGWPANVTLDRYYGLVQSVVPIAAHSDDFVQLFPRHDNAIAAVAPGPHIRMFAEDAQRSAKRLRQRGVIFGQGRAAVGTANTDASTNSCRHCGHCLGGCPYGLIFNSGDLVRRYATSGKVTYRPGLEVDRCEQTEQGVRVHYRDVITGVSSSLIARKVFLGAGVVPTARIVAASLGLDTLDLRVKDTCYFLIPFLRFAAARDFRAPGFRLVQGFLHFMPGVIGSRRVHLQVYGYNELFEQLAHQVFKGWRWGVDALLSRLMLMQGYLHSDESPELVLSLRRQEGPRYTAATSVSDASDARSLVRRVLWKLLRNADLLRGVPIVPLVKVEHPGRAFHSGGTFPMRSGSRARLETDTLGRLAELPDVHLVDASVFPSIPPTTITLSLMANAYRIANQSLRDNSEE